MNERKALSLPGIPALLFLLAAFAAVIFVLIDTVRHAEAMGLEPTPGQVIPLVLLAALIAFLLKGLFAVQPNVARVMQLFGRYAGSVREQGLRWTNPFYTREAVSLRVRNFESGKLKVNDLDGNPIEIGAIVVWQVVDTAEAVFMVDDYANFVHIQAESALRQMATSYSYDSHDEKSISLRGNGTEVNAHLRDEIQERLSKAGVEVVEARISHLAYAPEIAQAMLQRQQANAVIAARTRIVAGAVGMVEMALAELQKNDVVKLDEERKAQMVSNLLVVLCGERGTQPIVNTGSIY